ncbi:cytochrome c-type biogenesis protein [Prosthecodimorpha staleyi]|uniref:Cytochrome c-type biogenesis protein n=1 Tax=Prosthecodimorpha staleyi TaxID=2840188 RepID=A0A947GI94_9HYPH|nr:cytochrome c-type biogenesis protein [Prosthecodimorpha staleyi]MBT9289099.1 cytochrome c-type biogenesis protein CcmH [Prosthecodimorpha staleyi]
MSPAPKDRSGRRAGRVVAGIAAGVWLGLALLVVPAAAVQPDEILKDPVLEKRARAISADLRCMVCQNQSIDDSDAPLAKDLRVLVRERLVAGDSNAAVKDFLVARYGQFVLLNPRFEWETALLWVTPFAVLGIGAGVLVVGALRRRRVPAGEAAGGDLTAEERAALAEILRDRP